MKKSKPGGTPLIFLSVLVVWLLAACSSLPYSMQAKKIDALIDLLAEGNAAETAASTALPFVLDQELLAMPGDVERFWELAYQAGLDFGSSMVLSIRSIDEESKKELGSTWDMSTYAEVYLPADASLVEVQTAAGRFLLLLGGRNRQLPILHGLRGPL